MSEVTAILSQLTPADPAASEDLLPLVYEELRKLAVARLAYESPGLTLQATALVHEAYLRLVKDDEARQWNSRGHFFSAAAEAMRRILIEHARAKRTTKRGGGRRRIDLDQADLAAATAHEELIAFDDALSRLAAKDPQAGELVKLRYYSGLSVDEAAEVMGIGRSTAYDHWTFARAWLRVQLGNASS